MSTTPRIALVLGANGRFGQAAAQAFAAAGWQVLAQSRRPPQTALPPCARHLACDLGDGAGLGRAAAGASVVVHAINPPYTAWREQALPLARQGMEVAQRLGASFMLPGNVYNFGADMPPLLTEQTPERPTSVKGRIRCELEADMAARAAQGLRSVVLRAGDFYGGGSGNWFDRVIVKSLAQGKLVYPGPLHVAHAWAYLPDFARAFVAVAERPASAAHERLHFACHTLTGAELLDAIESAARALGMARPQRMRRASMPWGVIRAGGLLVPMWRELAEMAYLWSVPHALSGAALERRVGPLAATPLVEALRRSLLDLAAPGEALSSGIPATPPRA